MTEFDLHIHSVYSLDSVMYPKTILKLAKKKELDVVAVTDHETIRGGLETYKMKSEMRSDIEVIIGSEISTDRGDVIGLFLNEEVRCREIDEVIDQIHSQGGLVVLPHPFRGHNFSDMKAWLGKVDLIEILSCRSPATVEKINLTRAFRKKYVGCSDAHFPCEIGLCRTIVENCSYAEGMDDAKKLLVEGAGVIIKGRCSPSYLEAYSQLIKTIRSRAYRKIPLEVLYTVYRMMKGVSIDRRSIARQNWIVDDSLHLS